MDPDVAAFLLNFLQNIVQCFPNLGVVPSVITENEIAVGVQKGCLHGGGSNINSKGIIG